MQGNIAVIPPSSDGSHTTDGMVWRRLCGKLCGADTLVRDCRKRKYSRRGPLPFETKAAAARQGPKEHSHQKLERELGRELDAPRSPASQERVADAHVASGRNLVGAVAYFLCASWRKNEAAAAASTGL